MWPFRKGPKKPKPPAWTCRTCGHREDGGVMQFRRRSNDDATRCNLCYLNASELERSRRGRQEALAAKVAGGMRADPYRGGAMDPDEIAKEAMRIADSIMRTG